MSIESNPARRRQSVSGLLALGVLFLLGAGSALAAAPDIGHPNQGGGAQLNDSGQSRCYDANSIESCDPPGFPGGDGRYGRDAAFAEGLLGKIGAGAQGFDFTKIARDGGELPATALPGPGAGDWACTRDNASGSIWAIDTPGAEWADATTVIAAAANAANLCGFADWRLPHPAELQGLVHYGAVTGPVIDTDYFPATQAEQYWSADERAGLSFQAWVVRFSDGRVEFQSKTNARPVRLVRGDAAAGGFTDNGDGTVTDARTGLVWDRCSLGRVWDGSSCVGDAAPTSWQVALQAVQARNAAGYLGHADWRLPNTKELGSLTDFTRRNPAVDPTLFPDTDDFYWTSTTYAPNFVHRWIVDSGSGVVRDHGGPAGARLVRGGAGLAAHDLLRYRVGGSVDGLAGTGLVLALDGAGVLAIATDGAFVFATLLADGAAYAVTVQEQPPGETCLITNASGFIAGADVTDVTVDCTTAVSWTVTPSVAAGAGSISPATPQSVDGGHTASFVLSADPGSRIDTVTGTCGGDLIGATFVTNPVIADCSVEARFVAGVQSAQPLNDSGQSLCYDAANALVACEPANVPGQDGRYGRDAAAERGALAKLGSGALGFDFSKIARDGAELPASASQGPGAGDWACTRDNRSGATWIVATPEATWADATALLAADANAASLCGFSDWRLPDVQELLGLVHYGLAAAPLIDESYFPATQGADHWAIDERADNASFAWTVDFEEGATGTTSKTNILPVRLVRGAALLRGFIDNDDGTVTDTRTGLMWDRCVATQEWDGTTCQGGAPSGSNWLPGLNLVQSLNASDHRGFDDWRLPNVKELASIADLALRDPAIDTAVFPNNPPFTQLWSSTTATDDTANARGLNLFDGSVRTAGKDSLYRIRAVRGGDANDAYDRLRYSVGGNVSGLLVDGLVLQLNGGDDIAIGSDGPFVFPTRLPDGTNYTVGVAVQPDDRNCIVGNASGVIAGADIVNVQVSCASEQSWTVTPTVTAGQGAITPATPQLVEQGESASFTLDAASGWQLAGVAGTCGGTLVGNVYTTAPVVADCSVEAAFAIDTYTVMAEVPNGHGSIVPPLQTVEHGASASFALSADPGYQIDSVSGCAGNLSGTTYVTGPISADCTVSASFRVPTDITAESGTPQSTPAGSAFGAPLTVLVQYADSSPAANVVVQFNAPMSGASALLATEGSSGTALSVLTGADGRASVTANANASAGNYAVTATVAGMGQGASFALTNEESGDLAIAIDDDRDFIAHGTTANYLVVVANGGPSAISGIAIDNAFPAALDVAQAHWLCVAGEGVVCTAQGDGPLVDTGVGVAAGASAIWLLSAPVRLDAEGEIVNAVSLDSAADTNPANDNAVDSTVVVLMRNGFDASYVDPDAASEADFASFDAGLDADSTLRLRVPPASVDRFGIDVLLQGESDSGAAFRIERFVAGDRQWLRLVAAGADGRERISGWSPVDADSSVLVGLVDAGQGRNVLILADAADEIAIELPAAPSWRVRVLRLSMPVD